MMTYTKVISQNAHQIAIEKKFFFDDIHLVSYLNTHKMAAENNFHDLHCFVLKVYMKWEQRKIS